MPADTLLLPGLTLHAALHKVIVLAVHRHAGDVEAAARELQIDRLVVIAASQGLESDPDLVAPQQRSQELDWLYLPGKTLEVVKREAASKAIGRHGGDKANAARALDMSRSTLIAWTQQEARRSMPAVQLTAAVVTEG